MLPSSPKTITSKAVELALSMAIKDFNAPAVLKRCASHGHSRSVRGSDPTHTQGGGRQPRDRAVRQHTAHSASQCVSCRAAGHAHGNAAGCGQCLPWSCPRVGQTMSSISTPRFRDTSPLALPSRNVTLLPCLDSQCASIPAAIAMNRLISQGVSECLLSPAASVAACQHRAKRQRAGSGKRYQSGDHRNLGGE
jgi:hypothetical protein